MVNKKNVPGRPTMVRLPRPLHDRLKKVSAERSIQAGVNVSVSALIVEAVRSKYAPMDQN